MVDVVQYSGSGKELYPSNTARPKYIVHSGALAITELADAATDGYFWLINPLANTKNVAIRRVVCRTAIRTNLVCLTCPRITVERLTFTGTSAGAVLTPTKLETSESAATAIVTTAITGLTPTASTAITGFLTPCAMTAVGPGFVADQAFIPNISEEIILAPGEGVVVRQADAGTASDTRIVVVDVVWEEYLL
jgi:hypothetical protein